MPPLERFDLKSPVVYWQKTVDDGFGRPRLARAVEVSARVVFGRRDSLDSRGNVVSTDGTLAAGCELVEGSLVWVGGVSDLPPDTTPTSEVLVVSSAKATPDVNDRAVRYEHSFVYYKDSFPADSVIR